MEKEITATFIGHKECFGLENEAVKAELVKLIEQGVCVFLNGGMGGFDWKCAAILRDLKKEYPHIKSYLVIPYLTFKVAWPEYFDEIINASKPNRIILQMIIDKIYIHRDKTIRFKLKIDIDKLT